MIVWHRSYVRKMQDFRRQVRKKIFIRMLILAGLTTGLKDPTQRGPQFVVVHGGGEDGLVTGANLITFNKIVFLLNVLLPILKSNYQ